MLDIDGPFDLECGSGMFRVQRSSPRPLTASGEFRAGMAVVDVTPATAIPMTGHGPNGRVAMGVTGRLKANAMVIDDGRGERVALVFCDLHSGALPLLELAAARLGPSVGLGRDRLVLMGSHTHTGPGWIHGNTLYDNMSAPRAGFAPDLVRWLAGRIAAAVERAVASIQPAVIGFARHAVWGVSRNRSLGAFRNNRDAAQWNRPGYPGAKAPLGLKASQRAVDPRVSVLAAFSRTPGRPLIGCLATFACHATALGAGHPAYSPDWAGHASLRAAWRIDPHRRSQPVIGVASGVGGDAHALPWQNPTASAASPALAQGAGVAVGDAIAKAVTCARRRAGAGEIERRYGEPKYEKGAQSPYGSRDALARRWAVGLPTLRGSEVSRTDFWRFPPCREPRVSPLTPRPHRPKTPHSEILRLLPCLRGFRPAVRQPLLAIRIGSLLALCCPVEPTARAGFELERTFGGRAQLGAHIEDVWPLGYTGDYCGYLTTPREYDRQHYEGSSTLFGRQSLPHLVRRFRELLRAPQAEVTAEMAEFCTGPHRRALRMRRPAAPVPPRLRAELQDRVVRAQWCEPDTGRVAGGDWRVRIEMRPSGRQFGPLISSGRYLDDVEGWVDVWAVGRAQDRSMRWTAALPLPPRLPPDVDLRLALRMPGRPRTLYAAWT